MVKKKQEEKEGSKKRVTYTVRQFENELSHAMVTALTAALGFLMALTWRDVIVKFVKKVSGEVGFGGELISALVVTIACVFGVFMITRISKPKK